MKRTYEVIVLSAQRTAAIDLTNSQNALKCLDLRRRKARPKLLAKHSLVLGSATASSEITVKGVPSLVGMKEWLHALGHSVRTSNYISLNSMSMLSRTKKTMSIILTLYTWPGRKARGASAPLPAPSFTRMG